MKMKLGHIASACLLLAAAGGVMASSHREAPFITTAPKVDGTDFYMFNSYEAGKAGNVTLIANYLPLQDAYGGPNYFSLDPNALYEIHLDNNGDGKEDLTFQFQFKNELANNGAGITLPIGGKNVSIPLRQAGAVTNAPGAPLSYTESFTLNVLRGYRSAGGWLPDAPAVYPVRRRLPNPWLSQAPALSAFGSPIFFDGSMR